MQEPSETTVHQNKTFTDINYAGKQLQKREFIKCEFVKCDFSKSDLSHNDFVDCEFSHCNFSLTQVTGTGFSNITFTDCKILGIDFSTCNKFMFSFSFNACILDYSVFYGTKLRKTNFVNCSLKEVDFESADLSSAVFNNCDLTATSFNRTILEKTDFRTARNFSFDPALNTMKKARFSSNNLSGLLYHFKLDIED